MRLQTTSSLAAAALLATTAAADNSTSTCYTGVRTWTVRGTGESQNGTILATLGRDIAALEPDSYWTELDYPATLDFVSSVTQGVTTLASAMQQYYSACPNGKIVLVGYSQGALVVNVVLAGTNLAGGDIPPLVSKEIGENVKAIVMYGDPTRAVGQGESADCYPCTVGTPLGRTGKYLEAMSTYAGRLQEFCNAFDPVCCGNNAGVNAAHSSYFTVDQTEAALDFVKQKLDLVTGDDSGKNNGTCTKTFGPTSTANNTSTANSNASGSVPATASSTATSTSTPVASSSTVAPSSTTGAAPAASTGGAAVLASPSAGWTILVLGFAAGCLGLA